MTAMLKYFSEIYKLVFVTYAHCIEKYKQKVFSF